MSRNGINYKVVYPGKFQFPHLGHKKSYEELCEKFGKENVHISISDKEDIFTVKEKIFMLSCLDMNNVFVNNRPYHKDAIIDQFKDDNFVLIFAMSEKDSDRFECHQRHYIQKYSDDIVLNNVNENAYIYMTKTHDFAINAVRMSSSSELREYYKNASDMEKALTIISLYDNNQDKNEIILDILRKRLDAD